MPRCRSLYRVNLEEESTTERGISGRTPFLQVDPAFLTSNIDAFLATVVQDLSRMRTCPPSVAAAAVEEAIAILNLRMYCRAPSPHTR